MSTTSCQSEAKPLIFDIETGPLARHELAEFVPAFDAPSNYKRPNQD